MISVSISDSELLHRYAVEKSNDAFADLVRWHIDSVCAAALRQVAGETHLARDVTQIVFTDPPCKAGIVALHPVVAACHPARDASAAGGRLPVRSPHPERRHVRRGARSVSENRRR
jgi:hypothetical protein